MSKAKTAAFFHAACMNNFREVIHELLSAAKETGLKFDSLFVNIAGANAQEVIEICEVYNLSKTVHYQTSALSDYEYPAIAALQEYCRRNPADRVLYFHTKGVSRPDDVVRKYWRWAMTKFVIERWQNCLARLNTFDTVGYNWKGDHYSGGFWWANAAAINQTKPVSEIRKSPVHVPAHFTPQEVDRIQPEFFWRTAPGINAGYAGLNSFDSENRIDPHLSVQNFTRDAFEYAGLKIDKRYLLNLDSRVDRLQQATAELHMAGIKNVERFAALTGSNGIEGCYKSHLAMLKEAVEKKYNYLLVFEDDIRIEHGFQELFPQVFKAVPADWECLWIGNYERNQQPGEQVAQRVFKPNNIWGTHCYMLNKKGIERIYSRLVKIPQTTEIDIAMTHQVQGLIQYTIFPALINQSSSKSDLR